MFSATFSSSMRLKLWKIEPMFFCRYLRAELRCNSQHFHRKKVVAVGRVIEQTDNDVRVDPAQLDVYADRDLLEPVIINLVRNALQATQNLDGAHIEVSSRLNRRGSVVIEIADNGPGGPDDIATKIFVPFLTTKENGSGVGLALARQVMTAHSGFIRVSQYRGGGAIFTLTF
jgi:signal transduction histidine kinase